MPLDPQACYRAVLSRDRRFDGQFYTAVRTTGIYCRPSCPARTPRPGNVTFHRTAAAAQAAGYRACRRCVPDATPGSPDWDVAADVAGRAMRLIADGVVEREGVPGLAQRLGYSPRHLQRVLTAELGAGPLALARARRAQTARTLLETTPWPLAEVAFAAGFASVRQFNDTIREVYAATPRELRAGSATPAAGRPAPDSPSPSEASGVTPVRVRVAVRAPFRGSLLAEFLAARAVPGLETVDGTTYSRSLRLAGGPAVVSVELTDSEPDTAVHALACDLVLSDVRDLGSAVERVRRLVDADSDPCAVDTALARDERLAPWVRARPGLRVPGHVDGAEVAVRAVLGQQVRVGAATRLLTTLAHAAGTELPEPLRRVGVTLLFPEPAALVEPAQQLPMPQTRRDTVATLARALDEGTVVLDRSADRAEVRAALVALPGVGPWTAGYVAMRALGAPDVFLPTDAAVRRTAAAWAASDLRRPEGPDGWSPWRSYALMHLWSAPPTPPPAAGRT